jgi:hypothetical protein
MMRVAIVALLVLLPARAGAAAWPAGLTGAEAREAKKLRAAGEALLSARACIADAVLYTDADTDQHISRTWDVVTRALSQQGRAMMLILGANYEFIASPAWQALEGTPRAGWVSTAAGHRSNAVTYVDYASRFASDAQRVSGKSAAYYKAMACVASQMGRAKASLVAFDARLPYATPRKTVFAAQAVGPHGDMTPTLTFLAATLVALYASDDIGPPGGLRPAYHARANGEAPWPADVYPTFSEIIKHGNDIVRHVTDAMFNFVLVPVDAVQCTYTPFELVTRAFEPLLLNCNDCSTRPANKGGPVTGIPWFYAENWDKWLAAIRPHAAARPVSWTKWNRFKFDFMTSWRNSTGSTAAAFLFPDDRTLDTKRLNPSEANDPHTTAFSVCP